mmetsp:Transcript_17719/g.45595  ORF Transcript_17719/g.45595 Transcript_17719/m.45595 type:complete len:203 (-) Transcript_17719:126-734(-)
MCRAESPVSATWTPFTSAPCCRSNRTTSILVVSPAESNNPLLAMSPRLNRPRAICRTEACRVAQKALTSQPFSHSTRTAATLPRATASKMACAGPHEWYCRVMATANPLPSFSATAWAISASTALTSFCQDGRAGVVITIVFMGVKIGDAVAALALWAGGVGNGDRTSATRVGALRTGVTMLCVGDARSTSLLPSAEGGSTA